MSRNVENGAGFRSEHRARSVNPLKRLALAGTAVGAIIFGACDSITGDSPTITPTGIEETPPTAESLKCTDTQLKQADYERNVLGLQNGLTIITRHNTVERLQDPFDMELAGLLEEQGMCLRLDELKLGQIVDGAFSAVVPLANIDQAQKALGKMASDNVIVAVMREGEPRDFKVPGEITDPVERFAWFRQELIDKYGGQLYNHESRWILTAGVDLATSGQNPEKTTEPRERVVDVRFMGLKSFDDYLKRLEAFLTEFDPIIHRQDFADKEMFLQPNGFPDPRTLPGYDQKAVDQLIAGKVQ